MPCEGVGAVACYDAVNAVRLANWLDTLAGKLEEYHEQCSALE